MKNRQLLKRATAIIILFAMLLPFGAKKGVLKVSAAESYVNLLIDNFEDGTIPGNQSAAVTVAGKSVYGGSYANDAFGFGKMADIGYGSKQTSTQSVKYERNFENNFAAGEANSFVEFEFDLGIYKKTMSQMTLNLKSDGKQIGYLRWNTQGGALDVHYDFADSSKKTAATSDRAKSSSATATNKIDHIKIIMQTTDSSGNPVNIFKSFIIGDVVIAPSSDIAFTSNDVINGFDLTVNPPRAGWSACDAGLNLDNLVITRYTSADGAAPAPDRYAFFKKMIEKHSEIQSARNAEKISDEEYNELISVTENAASVYAAGITRESFAAAEDALDRISGRIEEIVNRPLGGGDGYSVLVLDNFEDNVIPGTQTAAVTIAEEAEYSANYANGAYGFGRTLDIGYGTKQTATQSVKYTRNFINSIPAGTANAYLELEFDLGIYKKTMSQLNFNLKSGGSSVGYLRWNSQGGALDVYGSSSQSTTVSSDKAKSSSASGKNKIDHIKIVIQITDSNGNHINVFKRFEINDTVINSDSGVSLGSSAIVDYFDVTLNPPRAGWAACDAGVNLDNFVVTRYVSANGTSPAPQRYELYKAIISAAENTQQAYDGGIISNKKLAEIEADIRNIPADAYKTSMSHSGFTAAYNKLNEIREEIDAIKYMKEHGAKVYIGTPYSSATDFIGIGSVTVSVPIFTLGESANRCAAAFLYVDDGETFGGKLLDMKTDNVSVSENSKETASITFDLNSYSADKSKMFIKMHVVENTEELTSRVFNAAEFCVPQMQIDNAKYSFSGDVNISAAMTGSGKIKTVIAVSGESEKRVSVIIMKKNKNLSDAAVGLNDVEYYGTVLLDGEGHAVFEHIPAEGTGEYKYAVCGLNSVKTGELYYADRQEIIDAFAALASNNQNVSNERYRKALGVNSEIYFKAVASGIDAVSVLNAVLAEQSYGVETVDKFAKSFLDKLGMLTGFKNAVSSDEIGQCIRQYSDEIKSYDKIRELTSKQKQIAYDKIYDSRDGITSIESMNTVIIRAAEEAGRVTPGSIEPSGGSGGWGYMTGGNRNDNTQSPVGKLNSTFGDISKVEWAKNAILEFAARGWICGKGDGIFAPFDNVTREEFIKMTVNVFGLNGKESECAFDDADKAEWYYPYISAAVSENIVNGISDRLFGVGRNITREDIAAIVYRTALRVGIKLTADGEYIPFSDENTISDYSYEAVVNLAKSGVLNGGDGNLFNPQQAATRAEAVKILYGVYTLRGIDSKVSDEASDEAEESAVSGNGKEKLLGELGIIDADKLSLNNRVTREEFVGYSVRMLGTDVQKADEQLFFDVDSSNRYYDEIYTAYKLGLIDVSHDGNFGAGDAVKINDAAEIMVRALNARYIAEEKGGYFAAAKYMKLLNGINVVDGKELTGEEVVQLLFNTLDSEYVTTENGEDYKRADSTILETGFSVYRRQGMLEACYYGNIYGTDSERSGYVMIDDAELMFKDDLLAKELLGCKVEFFYRKVDSGIYEVLYMCEKGNSIVEVSSDDAEKYTLGEFVYYKNDAKTVLGLSDKILTLVNGDRINLTASGVAIPDYGKIRLIDNNGDGKYDVAFIDDGTLAKCVDVSVSEKTIYTGSDKYRVIDLNKYDSFYIRDAENNEIGLADIEEDAILSICGKNDKSFIEIIVCSDKLEVVPERIYTEKFCGRSYIRIFDETGQSWRTVFGFEGISDENKIVLGNKYVFGMAPNGNIAAVLSGKDISAFKYGYIIKVGYKENTDKAKVKLLSLDDGVKVYNTAERIRRMNGSGRVSAVSFVNEYNERVRARLVLENEKRNSSSAYADYKILNEVIRFKTDKNDEIVSVEFPDDVSEGDGLRRQTELERVDAHISNRYYATDKLLGGTIPIDDDTIVFNVPARDNENDDSLYSATPSSKLANHNYYPLSVSYTYDNDIYAEVVVIPGRTSFTNTQSGYMLVNEVYDVYDEKRGETRIAIDGLVRGVMTTLYAADTCGMTYESRGVTYPVDEGDMIKYNTNVAGELSYIKVLFDNDRKVIINNNNVEENGTNVIWGGQAYVFGKVDRIYGEKYFTFSPRNYTENGAHVKPGDNGYNIMSYYYPIGSATQIYRFRNTARNGVKAEKIGIYDVPNLYNNPQSDANAVVITYEAETNFLVVYEY